MSKYKLYKAKKEVLKKFTDEEKNLSYDHLLKDNRKHSPYGEKGMVGAGSRGYVLRDPDFLDALVLGSVLAETNCSLDELFDPNKLAEEKKKAYQEISNAIEENSKDNDKLLAATMRSGLDNISEKIEEIEKRTDITKPGFLASKEGRQLSALHSMFKNMINVAPRFADNLLVSDETKSHDQITGGGYISNLQDRIYPLNLYLSNVNQYVKDVIRALNEEQYITYFRMQDVQKDIFTNRAITKELRAQKIGTPSFDGRNVNHLYRIKHDEFDLKSVEKGYSYKENKYLETPDVYLVGWKFYNEEIGDKIEFEYPMEGGIKVQRMAPIHSLADEERKVITQDTPADKKYDEVLDDKWLSSTMKDEVFQTFEKIDQIAQDISISETNEDVLRSGIRSMVLAAFIKSSVAKRNFIGVHACQKMVEELVEMEQNPADLQKQMQEIREQFLNGKEEEIVNKFIPETKQNQYYVDNLTVKFQEAANGGPDIVLGDEKISMVDANQKQLNEFAKELKDQGRLEKFPKISILTSMAEDRDAVQLMLKKPENIQKLSDDMFADKLAAILISNINREHPYYQTHTRLDHGIQLSRLEFLQYKEATNVQKKAIKDSGVLLSQIKEKSTDEKLALLKRVVAGEKLAGVEVPDYTEALRQGALNRISDAVRSGNQSMDNTIYCVFSYKYLTNPESDMSVLENEDAFEEAVNNQIRLAKLEGSHNFAMRSMLKDWDKQFNLADIVKKYDKFESDYSKAAIAPSKFELPPVDQIPAAGTQERRGFLRRVLAEDVLKEFVDYDTSRIEKEYFDSAVSRAITDSYWSPFVRAVNKDLFGKIQEKVKAEYKKSIITDNEAVVLLDDKKEALIKHFGNLMEKNTEFSRLLNADAKDLAAELVYFKPAHSDSYYNFFRTTKEGARQELFQSKPEYAPKDYSEIAGEEINEYRRQVDEVVAIKNKKPNQFVDALQTASPWYRGSSDQYRDVQSKMEELQNLYARLTSSEKMEFHEDILFHLKDQGEYDEFMRVSQEALTATNVYLNRKKPEGSNITLTGLDLLRYNTVDDVKKFITAQRAVLRNYHDIDERKKVEAAEAEAQKQLEAEQAAAKKAEEEAKAHRDDNLNKFNQETETLRTRVAALGEITQEAEAYIQAAMANREDLAKVLGESGAFAWEEHQGEVAMISGLNALVNQLEKNDDPIYIPDEFSLARYAALNAIKLDHTSVDELGDYLNSDDFKNINDVVVSRESRMDQGLEALNQEVLEGQTEESLRALKSECAQILKEAHANRGQKRIREVMTDEEKNTIDYLDHKIGLAKALKDVKADIASTKTGADAAVHPEAAARVYLNALYGKDENFKYIFGKDEHQTVDRVYAEAANIIFETRVNYLSHSHDFSNLLDGGDYVKYTENMDRIISGDPSLKVTAASFNRIFQEQLLITFENQLNEASKKVGAPSEEYAKTAMRYLLMKDIVDSKGEKNMPSIGEFEEQVAANVTTPTPEYRDILKFMAETNQSVNAEKLVDLVNQMETISVDQKKKTNERTKEIDRDLEKIDSPQMRLDTLGSTPNINPGFAGKEAFDKLVYNNQYGLDEDLIKSVTLGAMLHEEFIGKLTHGGVGDQIDLAFNQEYVLTNVLEQTDKARMGQYVQPMLDARKKAMEALDEYGKGNPEEALKYVTNLVKTQTSRANEVSNVPGISFKYGLLNLAVTANKYIDNEAEGSIDAFGNSRLDLALRKYTNGEKVLRAEKDLITGNTVPGSPARAEAVEKYLAIKFENEMISKEVNFAARKFLSDREAQFPILGSSQTSYGNDINRLAYLDLQKIFDVMKERETKLEAVLRSENEDVKKSFEEMVSRYVKESKIYQELCSATPAELEAKRRFVDFGSKTKEARNELESETRVEILQSDKYEAQKQAYDKLMANRAQHAKEVQLSKEYSFKSMGQLLSDVTPWYMVTGSAEFNQLRTDMEELQSYAKGLVRGAKTENQRKERSMGVGLSEIERLQYMKKLDDVVKHVDVYLEKKGENTVGRSRQRVDAATKLKGFLLGRKFEIEEHFTGEIGMESPYKSSIVNIMGFVRTDEDNDLTLPEMSETVRKALDAGRVAKEKMARVIANNVFPLNGDARQECLDNAKIIESANVVREFLKSGFTGLAEIHAASVNEGQPIGVSFNNIQPIETAKDLEAICNPDLGMMMAKDFVGDIRRPSPLISEEAKNPVVGQSNPQNSKDVNLDKLVEGEDKEIPSVNSLH